jgi:hypothetical protein
MQKGTTLIATTNCEMKHISRANALVEGKEYLVKEYNPGNNIVIESEIAMEHYFFLKPEHKHYYGQYFKIKSNEA